MLASIIVPLNADDLLKPREESRRYLPDIDLIKIRHQMADTSDDSSFKLRAIGFKISLTEGSALLRVLFP